MNVTHHSIVISDHSLITRLLNLKYMATPPQRNWRLNPQLFTECAFCDYLKAQVTFYFETNDVPGTSPFLLWEAMKA